MREHREVRRTNLTQWRRKDVVRRARVSLQIRIARVDNGQMPSSADEPNFLDNIWLAWRTRRAMHRGVRNVVRDLRMQGVVRAIPFLGFHIEPVVWLVTTTDVERDGLV